MSSIPAPRDGDEPVTHIQVIVTLTSVVPVLSATGTFAEKMAIEIVDNEIESFCADFGWQRAQLTATPVPDDARREPV